MSSLRTLMRPNTSYTRREITRARTQYVSDEQMCEIFPKITNITMNKNTVINPYDKYVYNSRRRQYQYGTCAVGYYIRQRFGYRAIVTMTNNIPTWVQRR